jgi:arylsulfatase A-like enzyme
MALALFLAKAVRWSLPESRDLVDDWLVDLSVSSYQDVFFAVAGGAVFQAALFLAGGRPRLQRGIHAALLAWGFVGVAYAVASIHIFAYLRSPLTYSLLYLAGDLRNMRSSVGAFLSGPVVAAFFLAPFAWLGLALLAARRWPAWPGRRTGVALAVALVTWLGWARSEHTGRWNDRADHLIAESPHVAFLASVLRHALGLQSRFVADPYTAEDLRDFEMPHLISRPARRPLPGKPPRNVILLVLETTGTRYLGIYGSKYPTTPSLQAEAKNLLVFDNFYCHVGLTANSMAAIELSVYPYMTWREYTVEYPRLPGKTLAQLFKATGHRTAFVHNGDLDYVNQRGFLTDRGFDDLWDVKDLGAGEQLTSWGAEDRALVDGLLRWIDEDRSKPFFVTGWTIQTHHPYDPSPDQPFIDFFAKEKGLPPDDYDLGRYLNTLHELDRQLGRLFAGLRERKLADDTVVVITGDHGESFGAPHEAWGHGSRLYQEGIQVPLLIWSPRQVRQGKHLKTIGSHVDVNPTIADLAGLPPDPSWHGLSMFDPRHPPRAYFYAANDDYLLGVREGDFKYVYNLTAGREELYDLAKDPDEHVNVAEQNPVKCKQLRQRVAAWRAHEGEHVAKLRAAMPSEPGEAAVAKGDGGDAGGATPGADQAPPGAR